MILMTRRKCAGFSLIELLVATGISVTLAALMISFTVSLLTTWNRSHGQLASSNQVKFLLDQLTTDLESAIFRADGNVWLAATVQGDQDYSATGDIGGGNLANWTAASAKPGWQNPGDPNSSLELTPPFDQLEEYRFGMAGVWLRFFSTVSDNADPLDTEDLSGPRAVAYQIVRHSVKDSGNSSLRYGLFRSEVRPYQPGGLESTFAVGYDILAAPYNDGNGSNSEIRPGRIRRPMRNHLLAMNVVDFGVRFWVRDGANHRLIFPADASGLASDNNRAFVATSSTSGIPPPSGGPAFDYDGAGVTTRGFPEIAEVFVRVLTDEGAQRVEAIENGTVQNLDWWSIALAHSQVYTRRINIPARVN